MSASRSEAVFIVKTLYFCRNPLLDPTIQDLGAEDPQLEPKIPNLGGQDRGSGSRNSEIGAENPGSGLEGFRFAAEDPRSERDREPRIGSTDKWRGL